MMSFDYPWIIEVLVAEVAGRFISMLGKSLFSNNRSEIQLYFYYLHSFLLSATLTTTKKPTKLLSTPATTKSPKGENTTVLIH